MKLSEEEYFRFMEHYTPNDIREVLLASSDWTLESIKRIKNLAAAEQARRKALPELFVECSYCKGFHAGKENTDRLCDKCDGNLAPYRYDVQHFGAERALKLRNA